MRKLKSVIAREFDSWCALKMHGRLKILKISLFFS